MAHSKLRLPTVTAVPHAACEATHRAQWMIWLHLFQGQLAARVGPTCGKCGGSQPAASASHVRAALVHLCMPDDRQGLTVWAASDVLTSGLSLRISVTCQQPGWLTVLAPHHLMWGAALSCCRAVLLQLWPLSSPRVSKLCCAWKPCPDVCITQYLLR